MSGTSSIKLRCKNLWQVFGSNPKQFFNNENFDPAHLAEKIRKSDHVLAASNINFDVEAGKIFVIMGLSGSGKSTVLRCLSRLVEPTYGEVYLDGQDILSASPKEMIEIRRHKMGMVFQNFALLPHLTVIQNIAFPLKAQGIEHGKRLERASQMIDLVGLQGRSDFYPHQLSGGQQQRVGIARSLAVEPEVWFLDEPFSALDPLIRAQMQDEFLRLQKQLNKTIIFVTHDFHEALRLADTICILKDGEIVQMDNPTNIVLRPANEYVNEFTGDIPFAKVLPAESIMGAPVKGGGKRPLVRHTALLEEAIKLFDGKTEIVDVVNSEGEVIGSLDPLNIIRALYQEVRPDEEKHDF